MNIGMVGYGKMGQLIAQIAQERGFTISEIIDPVHPEATKKEISSDVNADVLIDFTIPDAVISNVQKAAEAKKNLVIGTTGWHDHLGEVEKIINNSDIGVLWGSNFSPAVQMFFRTVRAAAKIANKIPECDIAAWEAHHRHKIDSPSGTAVTLGNVLLGELERKKELLLDRPKGKIQEEQLHLATIRAGEFPGTHAALFDFPAETIEVKSISRSRQGFALGAVIAAEWIFEKKGLYDFAQYFEEILGIH